MMNSGTEFWDNALIESSCLAAKSETVNSWGSSLGYCSGLQNYHDYGLCWEPKLRIGMELVSEQKS